VLRAERPNTKIIATEPDGAALLSDGRAQDRNADGSAGGSHPAWAPHMIQGWTPDFIPLVAQESIDKGYIDEVIPCLR
jgi:cysteine synthase A